MPIKFPEKEKESTLKPCPLCGKVLSYNSHFGGYICDCGFDSTKAINEDNFKQFQYIVAHTVEKLIIAADECNADRDTFIKHFASLFFVMAEISTFKNYKRGDKK